jgi:hypothetical protein
MSDLRFFNLSIPAPQRLALMRAAFAAHPTKHPNCPEYVKPKSWRDIRRYTLGSYAAAFATASGGFNDNRPVIYWHAGKPPVRSIKDAHEIIDTNHTGWYADNDGAQGLVIGIIGRLSHGRYLSGYRWTDNDERVLFTDEVFTDPVDAARSADREAERYAETLREDNERFRAMCDAESLVESKESDLCEAWADYRAAWADRHVSLYALKAAVKARGWVREIIGDLRAFREELNDAKRAYERG